MDVVNLPASHIYAHHDARPLNQERVRDIADSIREIGLLSPIIVRKATKTRNGLKADAYEILAGHHRFDAMFRHLNWEEIPCQLVDMDELRAELVTIDENLQREPPSDALRAHYIGRRKEIYEALHPETTYEATLKRGSSGRQIGNPDDRAERFTAATAKATGQSERKIQRDAARADALGAELQEIAGTSLDKGVEIDALAKLPAQDRRPIIEQAKAGASVSARKVIIAADPLSDPEAMEKQVARLMSAWNSASPEAREEFLMRIETPVFDQTAAGVGGTA